MELYSTSLTIIALILVFGVIGLAAVDTIMIVQDVEAKGSPNSIAANASKGRCII